LKSGGGSGRKLNKIKERRRSGRPKKADFFGRRKWIHPWYEFLGLGFYWGI